MGFAFYTISGTGGVYRVTYGTINHSILFPHHCFWLYFLLALKDVDNQPIFPSGVLIFIHDPCMINNSNLVPEATWATTLDLESG